MDNYLDKLERDRKESEEFFRGLKFALPFGCIVWIGIGFIIYSVGIGLGLW